MDFFQILEREVKGGAVELVPDFTVARSKDLMIRGRSFYAIWDEDQQLWSTDEYDVTRMVDQAVFRRLIELEGEGKRVNAKYLRTFSNNGWNQFRNFLRNVSDNSHQLDEELTFS